MSYEVMMIETEKLEPSPFNPSNRVDSITDLMDSIIEAGEIIVPLIVSKVNGRYIIVDGHRRWSSAKELGMEMVPVVIKDYEPTTLWRILNGSSKPIDGPQWMQAYHLGYPIEHIPTKFRRQIVKMEEVAGAELFDALCQRGRSPGLYSHVHRVAGYCGHANDLDFMRKVLVWIDANAQTYAATQLISMGEPASVLIKHIEENTPLRATFK